MSSNEMNNSHPQINQLLAYVDGRLERQEQLVIEELIKTDNEAKKIVEQFKESNLPYVEAFDHLLGHKISTNEGRSNKYSFSLKNWGAIAATLLMGMMVGFFSASYTSQQKNWVQQIVDYQKLYSRETVEKVSLSEVEFQQLEEKIEMVLGEAFKIPQLKEQGLDFKRGQILTLDNNPLIQLVYLPKKGKPVALCLIKLNLSDSDFNVKTESSLSTIEWSSNSISYVIVGDMADDALWIAAQQVKNKILF